MNNRPRENSQEEAFEGNLKRQRIDQSIPSSLFQQPDVFIPPWQEQPEQSKQWEFDIFSGENMPFPQPPPAHQPSKQLLPAHHYRSETETPLYWEYSNPPPSQMAKAPPRVSSPVVFPQNPHSPVYQQPQDNKTSIKKLAGVINVFSSRVEPASSEQLGYSSKPKSKKSKDDCNGLPQDVERNRSLTQLRNNSLVKGCLERDCPIALPYAITAATFVKESLTPMKENSTHMTGLTYAVERENKMEVDRLLQKLKQHRKFFLDLIQNAQEEYSKLKTTGSKNENDDIRKLIDNSTKYINSIFNLNQKDKPKYTALHYACKAVLPDIARLLVKSGIPVDLNAQNSCGDTPLHIAALNNSQEICKLFIEELKPEKGNLLAQGLFDITPAGSARTYTENQEFITYMDKEEQIQRNWKNRQCLLKLFLNKRASRSFATFNEGVFREIAKYA